MQIINIEEVKKAESVVYVFEKIEEISITLSKKEVSFIKEKIKANGIAILDKIKLKLVFVQFGKQDNAENERIRKLGSTIISSIEKATSLQIEFQTKKKALSLSLLEGIILSNYKFDKYFTKDELKGNFIKTLKLKEVPSTQKSIKELLTLTKATIFARDLVNEPVNYLTTQKFASIAKALDKVQTEVFNKSKIKALKMGGVLAVNKGSNEEPAFIVVEYKPKNAKNKKPIVLVGKGILYDTGGANIKTENFMMNMKSDMGGSAAVLGCMKAVSENELPVHMVGLVPVTENRINGNEIVPGDVIKMQNGLSVEVLNTDAEGRLVLADALSYSKKFKPELVIDLATLTGSAVRALGHNGACIMGTANEKDKSLLKLSSEKVHERVLEFPMWPEFEESLKSPIADLNNLGDGAGQMICAGFFLKNFVEFPWLHIDIAGPAFLPKARNYIPQGGTGYGVRLLYQFIKDKFALK